MAIHTLGTAIGSAIVPVLLKIIGGIGTLVACGIMMLISGVSYYGFEKEVIERNRKRPEEIMRWQNEKFPKPVTVEPKLEGWYKIYVCMTYR